MFVMWAVKKDPLFSAGYVGQSFRTWSALQERSQGSQGLLWCLEGSGCRSTRYAVFWYFGYLVLE